ncbi:Fic family protein [Serratia quinivorans]|uniref:Fic family protein n=1 Tax=Serratia quinivorans TaxID=137545 RepID=UPI003F96A0C1
MNNYLLQGNVIKLMPLNYPRHEDVGSGSWSIINCSTLILQNGIRSGVNYDTFMRNVEGALKTNRTSVLKHRLSAYVDNIMFANENKSSNKDFLAFSSLDKILVDILRDDDSFMSFIVSMGLKFSTENGVRTVSVRTVPESDGSYTEFLDVQHLSSELRKLRLFILNNYTDNKLFCSIIASVFFMHIHPLHDGNGRVSRVLFNLILGRDINNYIPMTELCHVARSGYVLSLREAFLFSEWDSVIMFYCKCIDIIHENIAE